MMMKAVLQLKKKKQKTNSALCMAVKNSDYKIIHYNYIQFMFKWKRSKRNKQKKKTNPTTLLYQGAGAVKYISLKNSSWFSF